MVRASVSALLDLRFESFKLGTEAKLDETFEERQQRTAITRRNDDFRSGLVIANPVCHIRLIEVGAAFHRLTRKQ